jgi:hypothetical protein
MKASIVLSIMAAAVLSACGGGGSGDGSSTASTSSTSFRMEGGGGACGNGCGGNGGGGSAAGGVGGGGGMSMMRNVTVSVSRPDGTLLGSAALKDGLVSIFPNSELGPMIVTFTPDKGKGEYFDEAKRDWVSLDDVILHVLMPKLNANFSANPFTEAAYRYALKQVKGDAKQLDASKMQAANDYIKDEFNTRLSDSFKITDITILPTFIDETKGLAALNANSAGRLGVVLSGMSFAAQSFSRNKLASPALAYMKQLVADIEDDDKINISVKPAELAYDATLNATLQAANQQVAATFGSADLLVVNEITAETAQGMAADTTASFLGLVAGTDLFGIISSSGGSKPASAGGASARAAGSAVGSVATAGTFPCTKGGTRTVTVVDANNNGELDLPGDMEKTVYSDCNFGTVTQNGSSERGAVTAVTYSGSFKLSGTSYYKQDMTSVNADQSSRIWREDIVDETAQQVDVSTPSTPFVQSLKGKYTYNSYFYQTKNAAGVVTYQQENKSTPAAVHSFDFTRQSNGTYQGTTTMLVGKETEMAVDGRTETKDKREGTASGNRGYVYATNLFWSGWNNVTRNIKTTNLLVTDKRTTGVVSEKYESTIVDEILAFDSNGQLLSEQSTLTSPRRASTITTILGDTSQLAINYKRVRDSKKDVNEMTTESADSVRMVGPLGSSSMVNAKTQLIRGLGTTNVGNNSYSLSGLLSTNKGFTFKLDSMTPDTKFVWTPADTRYPAMGDLRIAGSKNSSMILRAKGGNNQDIVYTTSSGVTGTIVSKWLP